MKRQLDRMTAIRLYGYLRQAERSVDYVLAAPSQWPALLKYYSADARSNLGSLLDRLRALGAGGRGHWTRDTVFQITFASLLSRCVCWLLRSRKTGWSFPERELSFFATTLASLLALLETKTRPETEDLVSLRMDLYTCEYVIQYRLAGVPELHRASAVEHFGQSDHVRRVPMADLERQAGLGAKRG